MGLDLLAAIARRGVHDERYALEVWDLRAGTMRLSRPLERDDEGSRVRSLVFDPDGLRVHGRYPGHAITWPIDSAMAPTRQSFKTAEPLWNVEFSATGERLLSALESAERPDRVEVYDTGGGLARLFSLPSGAPVSSLRTGQDGRATAAFSPDGAALVVLDARGLTLWDAGRGAVLHRLERPALEAFDLSPDGQTIAAVDESATLHLWRQRDASWRHETRALQPGAYKQVRFLADGRTVAVSVAHLIWLVELSQADREQPAARSER